MGYGMSLSGSRILRSVAFVPTRAVAGELVFTNLLGFEALIRWVFLDFAVINFRSPTSSLGVKLPIDGIRPPVQTRWLSNQTELPLPHGQRRENSPIQEMLARL